MNRQSDPRDSKKALLNIKEFCDYLGIGQTKAREILSNPYCTFSFRIGNRVYANKKKLEEYLENNRMM